MIGAGLKSCHIWGGGVGGKGLNFQKLMKGESPIINFFNFFLERKADVLEEHASSAKKRKWGLRVSLSGVKRSRGADAI